MKLGDAVFFLYKNSNCPVKIWVNIDHRGHAKSLEKAKDNCWSLGPSPRIIPGLDIKPRHLFSQGQRLLPDNYLLFIHNVIRKQKFKEKLFMVQDICEECEYVCHKWQNIRLHITIKHRKKMYLHRYIFHTRILVTISFFMIQLRLDDTKKLKLSS